MLRATPKAKTSEVKKMLTKLKITRGHIVKLSKACNMVLKQKAILESADDDKDFLDILTNVNTIIESNQ